MNGFAETAVPGRAFFSWKTKIRWGALPSRRLPAARGKYVGIGIIDEQHGLKRWYETLGFR